MLLDVSQEDGNLIVSYYNFEGKTRFKHYELTSKDLYNWYPCDANDKRADLKMKNWDGTPVRKGRTKHLNKYRVIEYLENIPEQDKKTIFGYDFPKTYFIDIEVEVTDSFPEPEKAENAITAICIVTPANQCVVLATRDIPKEQYASIENQINEHFKSTGETFTFDMKCFKSEYDMLYTFLKSFVRKFPMMTGWNFVKFDWAYIVNRAKKLGIDASIASPLDRLFSNNNYPSHVGVMDYMEIYSKWDRTVSIKDDLKLDTAGAAVLGIKKIKYDGTLQDLYEKEYPKYIFYNAVDTALVQLIHKKIKTMDIALTISHMSRISIFKAASPVAITESLLCKEFLKQNRVMATLDEKNTKSRQYEGAFVKQPITGMHNSVACFDFASLYPSIMRQMNVSPESFIKKVDPKDTSDEKADDRIVAINGVVYKSEESILKRILADLYSQRREYKKKSFELQQKAYDLEKTLPKT